MVLKCSETERRPKIPPAPNFSAPLEMPRFRWGSTRILRCQLTNGDDEPLVPPPPPPPPPQIKKRKVAPRQGSDSTSTPRPPVPDRPSLVVRFTVRSHAKDAVPEERDWSSPPVPEARFNLRSKAAAAAAAPNEIGRPVEAARSGKTPVRPAPEGEEKRKKRNEKMAEFRLVLTKEEIEADFIAMTGAKPPRRPNRRPRTVQNQLDSVFPGSWLPKIIAPDRYRVTDLH